ncbi:helix-turn-helix domain-containing protein [Flavobacterium sp. GCM10023249]|uniref:helix-turn-helix domain-containing protein n=1 Tax=unclassified Flavobacterium TaxID=196869 RepID=UPI003613298D
MVNIDDFIKRLELILEYYSLSASSFADRIGVQRSSLSHLLSGRNKPSLDLILKIVNEFPEVDLYWIINGVGNFPKNELQIESAIEKKPSSLPSSNLESISNEIIQPIPTDLFSAPQTEIENKPVDENQKETDLNTQNFESIKVDEEIEQIVIFFKNGSFKIYKNQRPYYS